MKKSLGILGGMGPLATADLFTKIVQMTDAKRDNDHLRVYIDNNAQIPDRTAAILSGGADPVPAMAESAQKLASMGAELLIMPCNTAHYFLPRLREQCSVPFLNMIEITAERCRQTHGQAPAGLLATRGTIQTGLYRRALEAQGVPCVEPDEGERDLLMNAIYAVKSGRQDLDKAAFLQMLAQMKTRGARYFILGCTELPIVAQILGLEEPLADPTALLAQKAIEECGGQVVLKGRSRG